MPNFKLLLCALLIVGVSGPPPAVLARSGLANEPTHADGGIGTAGRVSLNIESGSATALLEALQNPALDQIGALKVARFPANIAAIKRAAEFAPSNEADFVEALMAAAHGRAVTKAGQKVYEFDTLRPRAARPLASIDRIDRDPAAFRIPAERRVASFTPPGLAVPLEGYIIAGGPSGGFNFGGSAFYLNIGYEDDLDPSFLP